MKITVLVENSVDKVNENALGCEHGLSLLIEYKGKKILLDTGSSPLFAQNAKKLNVSLADVDFSVLSHGHYDHSGGYEEFFEENKKAQVYVRPQVFNEFFSGKGGMHQIGVPKMLIDKYFSRFKLILGLKELFQNAYLVPHNTINLEKIGERAMLYQGKCGKIQPDNFNHEQSLVIDTPKGLVIFNSCSHGGMDTIIDEAKSYIKSRPIYAYVGGLHMKSPECDDCCIFTDDELDTLCSKLKKENIKHIFTGHCTGNAGFKMLKSRLGDVVQPLSTGLTLELAE